MAEAMPQTVRPVDLEVRTRVFALRIIHLYAAWPKSTEGQVIGKQILCLRFDQKIRKAA